MPERCLQDRWLAGGGGQCRPVTLGNLSNESVEAVGELATGLVARLAECCIMEANEERLM